MPDIPASSTSMVRLVQLTGQGFLYPEPSVYRLLSNHSYQEHIAELTQELFGEPTTLTPCRVDAATWESLYIDLFHTGKKGAPVLSLNSGSYDALLAGQSRPAHLIGYSSWYKHFGLNAREDAPDNILPDHIVCQLEFFAWLLQLEDGAKYKPEVKYGYQRAQRDFLSRHLLPFLEVLVAGMHREMSQRKDILLYQELADLALLLVNRRLEDLASLPEEA